MLPMRLILDRPMRWVWSPFWSKEGPKDQAEITTNIDNIFHLIGFNLRSAKGLTMFNLYSGCCLFALFVSAKKGSPTTHACTKVQRTPEKKQYSKSAMPLLSTHFCGRLLLRWFCEAHLVGSRLWGENSYRKGFVVVKLMEGSGSQIATRRVRAKQHMFGCWAVRFLV